jgi:hypothetical protein
MFIAQIKIVTETKYLYPSKSYYFIGEDPPPYKVVDRKTSVHLYLVGENYNTFDEAKQAAIEYSKNMWTGLGGFENFCTCTHTKTIIITNKETLNSIELSL